MDRVEMDFGEVLGAAQRGQTWALEELWRRYSPAVAGYARLEGVSDSDDLTSEVFLGALPSLRKFRGGETQFRSWLFTIAYRRVVDDRRARGRRPEDLVAEPDPPDAARYSAEDLALDQIRANRVVELCHRLVPAQRDVLLLRLVAALTVDEVAHITRRNPGAVKALQRRGLASLSRSLQQQGVTI